MHSEFPICEICDKVVVVDAFELHSFTPLSWFHTWDLMSLAMFIKAGPICSKQIYATGLKTALEKAAVGRVGEEGGRKEVRP